jgi:peroxiredoxin
MQKIIISLSAIALLASCGGNKKTSSFELKGTLTDSKGETIYLEKLTNPQPVTIDSTVIDEKGNFEFTNYTPKIGFYRIKTSAQNFAMLVLDSTDKVKVTGSVKDLGNTYKVEGSPETKLFLEFNEIAKKNRSQLDSLNQAFQRIVEEKNLSKNTKAIDSLSNTFQVPYEAIVTPQNKILSKKIIENSTSYSSLMAIQGMDPEKYIDVYKALDKGLYAKYPLDANVVMFHGIVSKMVATTMGQVAPEINLPSPEGTNIALSSLKGKIVLVDFWASWCGPCRKEMPNVVKAYAKYKDKGFEIYGVSLDQDKERWAQAIKQDGITWPQVSDLKQWDCEPAKQYGVTSIPATFLLDKEGKIIAKNLRGEELEKAIENALAGKSL